MDKISVDDKRALDSEFTKQLLANESVRAELIGYANDFIEAFDADTYRLFDELTIGDLCSLSVKGGLGIVNLRAHQLPRPPATLVWDGYQGDCDLNLLIKKDKYPVGRTTGEVMAAVAQRIKILLVRSIASTRYCTLPQDLRTRPPVAPLYLCNQLEALGHLMTFVGQDLHLPIPPGAFDVAQNVDTMSIAKVLASVVPGLVALGGPDLEKVFTYITSPSRGSFVVYHDPEKRRFFVSNLQLVRSSWADVDYSFFPYAPGRMDSLGFEVSELAMDQQKARQNDRTRLPYDVFKVTSTPFEYTQQDLTNDKVSVYENRVYTADDVGLYPDPSGQSKSPYNLSMYANNLIDDFDLIRTALLFTGYFVHSEDVQAVPDAPTTAVSRGSAKCEFVDVAVPRIGAPEWFYLQERTYYFQVPQNPAPNQTTFKICNWEYQAEENLNLLIELDAGHSHSGHKATKRILRLAESWLNCEMATVFPRPGTGVVPPGVVDFKAPAIFVSNFADDYRRLLGLVPLPDSWYNYVFERLYAFNQSLQAFPFPDSWDDKVPSGVGEDEAKAIIEAAGELGRVGLQQMVCMAEPEDAPHVSALRELVQTGAIAGGWSLAAYLLLKASRIADKIWFPTQMIFQVEDAAAFGRAYPGLGGGAHDYMVLTLTSGVPGHVFTITPLPADELGSLDQPIDYSGELTLALQRLLNQVRTQLLHANNQMLRIGYAQILNALTRVGAESYLGDVIPLAK